jgi:hypothetical protein
MLPQQFARIIRRSASESFAYGSMAWVWRASGLVFGNEIGRDGGIIRRKRSR